MIEHIWSDVLEECSCGCGPYDDTMCGNPDCLHCGVHFREGGAFYVAKEPEDLMTGPENNKCKRAVMLQYFAEQGLSIPSDITCDECGCMMFCKYAYDMYNTDGDCIASK